VVQIGTFHTYTTMGDCVSGVEIAVGKNRSPKETTSVPRRCFSSAYPGLTVAYLLFSLGWTNGKESTPVRRSSVACLFFREILAVFGSKISLVRAAARRAASAASAV